MSLSAESKHADRGHSQAWMTGREAQGTGRRGVEGVGGASPPESQGQGGGSPRVLRLASQQARPCRQPDTHTAPRPGRAHVDDRLRASLQPSGRAAHLEGEFGLALRLPPDDGRDHQAEEGGAHEHEDGPELALYQGRLAEHGRHAEGEDQQRCTGTGRKRASALSQAPRCRPLPAKPREREAPFLQHRPQDGRRY